AGSAADGAALTELLQATPCDVLVVDLSLPHLSGMELIRAVAEWYPTLPMVVFTMQPEDALALHIVRSGASAYLCKDRSSDELLEAIRHVSRGHRYLTDRLRELEAAEAASSPGASAPHESLSARQTQVFRLLLEGRSVSDIAAKLEMAGSTTSNHIAEIRRKLGVDTVGEIVLYAHRMGLLG
ncbi:MAG: response regulator transcription factor, partial [Deltaproteobacteria bacterium]|nr:response regulator transcription factor [Deltaproteobacteria bacterium]